jgi:WD40 repeat protein
MTEAHLAKRAGVALDTYIVDCTWSSDSRAVAVAGGEGAVLLVASALTRPEVRVLGEHAHGTLAIAWQPGSGSIASSGQDGKLMLWNEDAAVPEKLLGSSRSWTDHLAYACDGKLAAATGKTVDLWSRSGERIGELPYSRTIAAIAWDPAGQLLAAATHHAMWLHRIAPPDFAAREYEVPSACLTAAFSPNGRMLAAGMQDGAVYIFHHRTQERDSQMRGYDARVPLAVWSGNSRQLATSCGAQIIVWDCSGKGPEGSKPLELLAHTDRIDCLAYQPNGPWLVSGARDWRLALWLPGKAERPVDVHSSASAIAVLRWSPDGRFLAVGERAGQLSIYELVTKSASPIR